MATPKTGRAPGRPRLIDLVLTVRHSINGTEYGPGHVRVPEPVAAVLREQEQRFRESEERLYRRGAAIVGEGRRLIRVAPELFDEMLTGPGRV